MQNHPERPVKTRFATTTLELCVNIKAGPHGSIELIHSPSNGGQPVYFFWPLSAGNDISPDQFQDLQNVVLRESMREILMRGYVQLELPTDLEE